MTTSHPVDPANLEPATTHEWRLEKFAERIRIWSTERGTPPELLDSVIRWVMTELKRDPLPARSQPMGPGFPPEYRFLPLPFVTPTGEQIGCSYVIRRSDRTIQCLTFDQVRSL